MKAPTCSHFRPLLPGICLLLLLLGTGNARAEGGVYLSPCHLLLDDPHQSVDLVKVSLSKSGHKKKQALFKLSFNNCPQAFLSDQKHDTAAYKVQGVSGAILKFPNSNGKSQPSLSSQQDNGVRPMMMFEDNRGHSLLPSAMRDGSHTLPPGNTVLWFSTQFETRQETSQVKSFGDVVDVQIAYL